jgi:hypothetical protein
VRLPRAIFHALRRNFAQQQNHLEVQTLIHSLAWIPDQKADNPALSWLLRRPNHHRLLLGSESAPPIGFDAMSGD